MDNLLKSQTFLGIDPGSTNSAFAFYNGTDYQAYTAMDTATRVELIRKYKPVFCVLEKVNLMPGQGIASGGKFMKSVGVWCGILETLEIPYQEIRPATWAKGVGLNMPDTKGLKPSKRKQVQKDYKLTEARKRFPKADLKLKKSIDSAEALWMALYASKIYNE